MMKGRELVLVGAGMYGAAWFLPTLEWGSTTSFGGTIPGWEAFLTAVWLPYRDGWDGPWYTGVHYVASGLSNIVLVGALALVLVARRSPSRLLTGILFACAVLNTHWFILGDHRLRIGYYLWAISFFLIAAGLALDVRRAGSEEPPAV